MCIVFTYIKLVLGVPRATLDVRETFFIDGQFTDIVRPDSAWEYRRPYSAGRAELILRQVPENDYQVVIDFNGNSRIEQQADILLEVTGSVAGMEFDSVFNLMATDGDYDQLGVHARQCRQI